MSVLLLLLADKGLDYECNSFHTLSFYLWTAVIFASWKESLNGTYRAFPGNKKKCGNFISVRTAPISYWSAGLLGFLSPPLLLQQTIHPFYSTLRSRHHLLLLLPNFFFFAPVRCAFISDTQLLLAPPSKWAPLSSWWVQQKRARAAGGHLSARLPQWWIDRGVRTEQPTALSVTCKKKKKKKKSSLPYVYGERHRLETGQKLEATRHSSM